MRILHVIPHYEPAWYLGGVVRCVSLLCRGLADLGIDITVFTTDSGRDRRLEVPINRMIELGGVKVWYFKNDFYLKYAFSKDLGNALKQSITEFDLINLSSPWCYPGIITGIYAKKYGIPNIVFPHGTLADYALAQKWLKKKIYLKLFEKRILGNATALRYSAELEREKSNHQWLKVPSFLVPNGIDLAEFNDLPNKKLAKETYGLSMEKQAILYLGRLARGKGLELLIAAFAEAAKYLSHAVLILAGPDFGMEKRLKDLAKKLRIDSRVLFTGYVNPEKRKLILRAADLMALLSDGENFGMVVVEAMLAGLPVLLSDQVGICREVVTAGAGVMVSRDQGNVAQTILNLLNDQDRLDFMGQVAAESARQRYDNKKVCRLMLSAFEDVLSGRRSPCLSWSGEEL